LPVTLRQAVDVIRAEVIVPAPPEAAELSGGFAADLMSDVLAFAHTGSLLITGLATDQMVRTAAIKHLAAVVVVEGKQVDGETVEVAQEEGIAIFRTSLPKYEVCGLLVQAGLRPCRRNSRRLSRAGEQP
jgi:predicted transcriptional regulator